MKFFFPRLISIFLTFIKIALAVVGDETGTIVFTARDQGGPSQVDHLQPGATLDIRFFFKIEFLKFPTSFSSSLFLN